MTTNPERIIAARQGEDPVYLDARTPRLDGTLRDEESAYVREDVADAAVAAARADQAAMGTAFRELSDEQFNGVVAERDALRLERDARLADLVEALGIDPAADWDAVVHETERAAVHCHAVCRERDALLARTAELEACIDQIVEMSQGDMDTFDAVYGVAHAALKRCPACFPKAAGKGVG